MKKGILLIILMAVFGNLYAQKKDNAISAYLLFPVFNHYTYYNATYQQKTTEDGCYGFGGGIAYTVDKNRLSADYTIAGALSFILLSENVSGDIDYFKRCNILDVQYHRQLLPWLSVVGGLHTASYHQSFFDTTGTGKYVDLPRSGMGITAGLELVNRHYAGLGFYYRPSFISFNGKPSNQMLSFVLLIPLVSVPLY